jgi:hypothetical protein
MGDSERIKDLSMWEYEMDECSGGKFSSKALGGEVRDTLRSRAAEGWELVNATGQFQGSSTFLFWRRSAKTEFGT